MKANWILIALFYWHNACSQGIAAYSDINGQFFVFDDGVFSRLEYQTVQSYKAGFNQLGYIDNMGKLKWYMEGKKVIIEDYAISNYFVTDHLIAYTLGDQLVVVDAGERKTLKYNKGAFMVGDSLISFYDSQNNFLKTYYNGKVYEIEDGLGGLPFKSMLSSDNLMAYVDRNDYLKMFYRGGLHDLSYNIASYRVGKNTIAYVEGSSAEFKIEYKGEHFDVALLPPRSYKVADNLVAFVDDSESFMVFYDGEIYEISSFPPDFYKLGENMLVYSEDGFFKVFYEGHTYSLVNYIPSNYYLNNNTVAYLGQQNQLELFYKGDQLTMSYEPLLRIETFPHCIAITKHPHSTSIFYNGKEYVRE